MNASTQICDLAVLIAGRRRAGLRDEWHAHLVGENGHEPGNRRKTRAALGLVSAAVRYRARDAADLAWRPADAVLRSRIKSNLLVWLPVLGMVLADVHQAGWYRLVIDVQNLIALGAFLSAAIRAGRWWRAVRPINKPRTSLLTVTASLLSAVAGGLLTVATRLLPAADRARYEEEYQSELREIAQTGRRWAQLAYAARQVLFALQLRRALRSPPRRGAAS